MTLERLVLRPACFEGSGFPLTLRSGTIGSLRLQLPWAKLSSQPAVLDISDVVLVVSATAAPVAASAAASTAAAAAAAAAAAVALRAKQQQLVHQTAVGEGSSGPSVTAAEESVFQRSLLTKVLDNLQLSVKRVRLHYCDCIGGGTAGDTLPRPGCTCCATALMCCDEIFAVSTSASWEREFVAGAHTIHKVIKGRVALTNLGRVRGFLRERR